MVAWITTSRIRELKEKIVTALTGTSLVPEPAYRPLRLSLVGAAVALGLHLLLIGGTLIYLWTPTGASDAPEAAFSRTLTLLAVEVAVTPPLLMGGILLSIARPTRRFGLGLLAGSALGFVVALVVSFMF